MMIQWWFDDDDDDDDDHDDDLDDHDDLDDLDDHEHGWLWMMDDGWWMPMVSNNGEYKPG